MMFISHFLLGDGLVRSINPISAQRLAIMISKGVQFRASHVQADSAGRYVIVVGNLYLLPVILACIYATNWDDPTFFTISFSHLPDLTSHYLILTLTVHFLLS